MDNLHNKTDILMEWAEEVANKCGRSSTYVIAQFCYTNNRVQDVERAKIEVANKLINGGKANEK